MTFDIRKVAVLGAGTMGGGIAAHLANIGIPVVLLDMVPPDLSEAEQNNPKARNRIVQSLYDRMAKARPANLARADRGDASKYCCVGTDFGVAIAGRGHAACGARSHGAGCSDHRHVCRWNARGD
jgi:3-hydroxyacyl-CoA dehydrogenase